MDYDHAHEAFDPTERVAAIPTLYKQTTFRSRTEARWAVFFDAMGIEWEYEPEGLQLPTGERYLPDFYLPRFRWFAEVKPTVEIARRESKARFFAARGIHILLLNGHPDFEVYDGLGSIPETRYSLDITDRENRFWSDAEDRQLEDYSDRYRDAVRASRLTRFEAA